MHEIKGRNKVNFERLTKFEKKVLYQGLIKVMLTIFFNNRKNTAEKIEAGIFLIGFGKC